MTVLVGALPLLVDVDLHLTAETVVATDLGRPRVEVVMTEVDDDLQALLLDELAHFLQEMVTRPSAMAMPMLRRTMKLRDPAPAGTGMSQALKLPIKLIERDL